MVQTICSCKRLLLTTVLLTALLAAPGTAAPPASPYQGALYPSYASPYYPAYRPSTSYSSPGPYYSSRVNPYGGYIPGTNYARGFEPGFASFYAKIAPMVNLVPESRSRFYIPSSLDEAVDATAHLEVLVPESATLWIDDWKARSTGVLRKLQSPPLTPGRHYTYTIRARWEENGREVTQMRKVDVSAGAKVRVDFLGKK